MNLLIAWLFLAALVLTLAVAMASVLAARRHPPVPAYVGNRFVYKYQRHPFDDPQFFVIFAPDPDAADVLALTHFEALFEAKQTVMSQFYRASVGDAWHPNFPK